MSNPHSHTSVIRSVTTRVAGLLATEAFAHHYGTPQQQIGVRAGDTLTYLDSPAAAVAIARAFADGLDMAERQQLVSTAPATWLGLEPGTYPPGLLTRFGTAPVCAVGYQTRRQISGQTVPAHVWVRVGPVLWQVCDHVAADRLAQTWSRAARLLTMPDSAPPTLESTPEPMVALTGRPETAASTPRPAARRAGVDPADSRSDAELLTAYIEGDRDALGSLAVRRHGLVEGAVRRVLGANGEVEDAVQDTWLRVARGADSFRGDCAVTTWLWRIAHHAALYQVRSQRPGRTTSLEQRIGNGQDPTDVTGRALAIGQPSAISPEGAVVRVDTAVMIEKLLAALPDHQRVVVELTELQGLDIASTATHLGIAEGTVKSRRLRARARMATMATQWGMRLDL